MRERKAKKTKWTRAENRSFAAWFAEKTGSKFTLQYLVGVGASMGLAAILCRLAGTNGWLVGGLVAGGMALFITLRRQADAQTHFDGQGLLEKLSDSLPGMVYQCRLYPTGRCALTYANEAIRWIYEKEHRDVQHDCSSIMDLVHPDDRERIQKSLLQSALCLTPWKEEYRVVLPRQGTRWRFAQARIERLVDGSTLWHGFIADITARKEADERLLAAEHREAKALRAAHTAEQKKIELLSRVNKNLREESTHDHLTGVFLRRYFDRRFPKVFERARLKRPVTLVFCDIDSFKAYNDTFGHLAGDHCLNAVAQALAGEISRSGQILARYGGEEFVAVLPGLGSARALQVAEQMRRAVEALGLKAPGGENHVVTISVGVACIDHVSKDMTEEMLLRAADEALYEAKQAGRNCVRHRKLDLSTIRDSQLPDSAASATFPPSRRRRSPAEYEKTLR